MPHSPRRVLVEFKEDGSCHVTEHSPGPHGALVYKGVSGFIGADGVTRWWDVKKVPKSIKLAIRAGGRCIYCGTLFSKEEGRQPTVEHLVPKSLGGGDGGDNIAASCEICNNEKGQMTHEEYLELLLDREPNERLRNMLARYREETKND